MTPRPLAIAVPDLGTVSALWQDVPGNGPCLVLAHGAGAGMTHPAMAAAADGLARRGVAILRYQFPFMERGTKRPDPPAVAQATVRAAVALGRDLAPGRPLFAGGRSYGGRMTSQAEAASPMPGVAGLVFLAFPLHPAGRPGRERAQHLARIARPMLFLQGTRDALADPVLLRETVEGLGPIATLELADGADHAFHVLARSGRSDAEVLAGLLDAAARWMAVQAKRAA
ncbi:alpha/beta family hydrolase [Stella sp.]|uniref:alpha/beta hydrolase family protein n=1 Tax=Stella sp. TaxID=2912054 RepID=UPI0035AD8248